MNLLKSLPKLKRSKPFDWNTCVPFTMADNANPYCMRLKLPL